jgi:radical SAM superfamily enzyme YgiQ (UPF0313 family)
MRSRRQPSEELPRIKEWGRHFRVAIVYPGPYRVGMANLGLHALYASINRTEGMLADRFFVEGGPSGKFGSVERGMPLDQYDLVAFTVQFEPDYPAVVKALERGGLRPLSAERSEGDPLVIAGGPAVSANPEPLSDFIDGVFIGELEGGGMRVIDEIRSLTAEGADRDSMFHAIAGLPHMYMPSLVRFVFNGPETVSMTPLGGHTLPVRSARPPLAGLKPPSTSIFTDSAEFSDMKLVELTRGCTGGCRFCMSGFTTRPFRSFDPEAILSEAVDPARRRKTGLVGELFAAHPGIGSVMRGIEESGGRFSPSSIRLEHLDDAILDHLSRSGMKTLTLAPETGSQRLSRAINKPVDPALVLSAASRGVARGIENIRLYLMVGIPGETGEDVVETVKLAREMHSVITSVAGRSRMGRLTLSINPFIPKPWTPMQWAPFERREAIESRMSTLAASLKHLPNMEVRSASVDESAWEALLSMGDRRTGRLIELASANGWRKALKQEIEGFEALAGFAERERGAEERFPWETVFHGCTRSYLRREYLKFKTAEPTPVCDPDGCRACGAC